MSYSFVEKGLVICILLVSIWEVSLAQNAIPRPSSHEGATPPGAAADGPAGAYALSGFDHVNYYSKQMSFALPLLQIGGRGEAGYTMVLPYEPPHWQVRQIAPIIPTGPQGNFIYRYSTFTNYAADDWTGIYSGYGAGVMMARKVGNFLVCRNSNSQIVSCPEATRAFYQNTLTRLTFIGPGGSELEFVDQLTQGRQLTSGANRRKNWIARDGSGATFISDLDIQDTTGTEPGVDYPSGYLYFKNGVRYRIDSGYVTRIRDRHGNYITIDRILDGLGNLIRWEIRDSLNRLTTVAKDVSGNMVITLPRSPATPRQIIVEYSLLGNAIRPCRNIVGYQCFSSGAQAVGQLFPNLNNSQSNVYNPTVISAVVLPDGRRYKLYYTPYKEIARVDLPTGGVIEYDWNPLVSSSSTCPGTILAGGGDYVYQCDGSNTFALDNTRPHQWNIRRGVSERRVYKDAEQLESIMDSTGSQYDANRNLITGEVHYYYGNPGSIGGFATDSPSWKDGREWKTEITGINGSLLRRVENTWEQRGPHPWYEGNPDDAPQYDPRIREIKNSLLDNGSNLVSKVYTEFDDDVNAPFNNPKDIYEYDYGIGIPGQLIRRTQYEYEKSATYINAPKHLRSLVKSQRVFADAGGMNKKSETIYEYDNYVSDGGNHEALQNCDNIIGQEVGYSPSNMIRGNITGVHRWFDLQARYLSTYAQYDIVGNIVRNVDAKSNKTNFSFADNYADNQPRNTYAFATSVTTPAPGANGSPTGLATSTKYDYYLGKPVSVTDPNQVITSIEYNDPLDRISRVVRPTSGRESLFEYGLGDAPSNRFIRTRTKQQQVFPVTWLEDYVIYDGLGRTWRSAHYEGNVTSSASWSVSDTEFDALGRIRRTSNPYYINTSSTSEPPIGPSLSNALWTTTAYDSLSRVTSVTTPDGSSISTGFLGNRVTVTDEQGKQRSTWTDVLGRLVQVNEAPGASGYNYQTNYTYDVLGNLILVRQGGFPTAGDPDQNVQYRRFYYDSLSRLMYANNPEQDPTISFAPPGQATAQWTMEYEYDDNGNLTKRTDARGLMTEYEYDALNRNTKVIYPPGHGSYEVRRYYDTATNGMGRLRRTESYNLDPRAGVGVAYSQTVINSYNDIGQIASQTQRFAQGLPASPTWRDYATTRSYDLAGHVLTQGYPSGRSTTYSYNTAGRLSTFSGTIGDGGNRDYASEFQYNPAGLMTRETFGTAPTVLYHGMGYNSRYQMVETTLGTNVNDQGTWTRGRLWFFYNSTAESQNNPYADGPGNNGNVLRQEHHVPTAVTEKPGQMALSGVTTYSIPMRDRYTYDPLNRLLRVNGFQVDGTSPEAAIYSQGYLYDKFGNRKIDLANTSGNAINKKVYNPLPASNRLRELYYDAAGNVMGESDPGAPADPYTYDVENKMIRAFAGGVNNYYIYDGDGRRVRRIASGVEYWQVYGIDGELLDEYKIVSGAPESTPEKEYGYRSGQMLIVTSREGAQTKILWHVMDHLGTPRIQADQTGTLASIKRHDYLPFGEELFVGMGNGSIRSTSPGWGYSQFPIDDKVRQRFGGKERDNETDLDYFLARYFSSRQGRFISIDPENYQASEDLSDPQSWNAYSYVNNNPLRRIDPDGKGFQEKLKNYIKYGVWGTEEDVKREEAKRRKELKVTACTAQVEAAKLGVQMDVTVNGKQIEDLTRDEVFAASDNLREGKIAISAIDPVVPIGPRQPDINISNQQLQKKYKHAKDFGVNGNNNSSSLSRLREAIERHVADPATKIIKGTYRGEPVTHYVNPNTGLNVIKDASGNFLSGWKLNPSQLQNVLSRGSL